jgi:hypothetical protein
VKAAIFLALGTSTKLMPAILFAPILVWFGKKGKENVTFLLCFALTYVLTYTPFIVRNGFESLLLVHVSPPPYLLISQLPSGYFGDFEYRFWIITDVLFGLRTDFFAQEFTVWNPVIQSWHRVELITLGIQYSVFIWITILSLKKRAWIKDQPNKFLSLISLSVIIFYLLSMKMNYSYFYAFVLPLTVFVHPLQYVAFLIFGTGFSSVGFYLPDHPSTYRIVLLLGRFLIPSLMLLKGIQRAYAGKFDIFNWKTVLFSGIIFTNYFFVFGIPILIPSLTLHIWGLAAFGWLLSGLMILAFKRELNSTHAIDLRFYQFPRLKLFVLSEIFVISVFIAKLFYYLNV